MGWHFNCTSVECCPGTKGTTTIARPRYIVTSTKNWTAALAALSMWGCADALPDVDTRQQFVKDGTVDTQTGAALGLVRMGADGGTGICTAALIAPHLAVTSRNCVSPVSSQFIQCGTTRFDEPYSASTVSLTAENRLASAPEDFIQTSRIIVPDDDGVCGNDIAVLVLDSPFGADVTPFVPTLEADLSAGDSYTFYGYGHIGDGTGSGVRRSSTGEVTCVGDGCPEETTVAPTEFVGVDGPCQGDGGGPAVIANEVVGLSSRGAGNCETSTYSMVASFSDFIVDAAVQASEEDGYPLPEWAGRDPGTNNNTGTNSGTATNNTNNGTGTNNETGTNNDGTNNDGANNDGTNNDGGSSDGGAGCSSVDSGFGQSPLSLLIAFVGLMLAR